MESSLLLNLTDENFQRKTSRGPSLNSSCNHEAIKYNSGGLAVFSLPKHLGTVNYGLHLNAPQMVGNMYSRDVSRTKHHLGFLSTTQSF